MNNPEGEDGELVLIADQIPAQKFDQSGELLCIVLGGKLFDCRRGWSAEGLGRRVFSLAKFGYQCPVPPFHLAL